MVLAGKIDWNEIDRILTSYYAPGKGRPAKPTRLMVGIMILKHRFNLSDEAVVSGLHENFVWMTFCQVPADEARQESSTLCRLRKRLGAEGTQAVEAVIREQMIQAGVIRRKVMRVDTTAMEKNIAYPTDIGLRKTIPDAGASAGAESKRLGSGRSQDSSDFCTGQPEGGSVGGEIRLGQEGPGSRIGKDACEDGRAYPPASSRPLPGDRKESAQKCAEGGVPRPGPNPGHSSDGSPDPGTDRDPDEEPPPGDPDSDESLSCP